MESNKRQGPPYAVDIPKGKADDPSWLRVAAIALVGFVVGVAWPKIAGVRVGPSAPPEAIAAHTSNSANAKDPSSQSSAEPSSSAQPASSAGTPSASLNAPQAAALAANAPDILVKNGILLACRTDAGETIKGLGCGPIAFDAIAQPRIKRLSQCAAAQGADGKFGVVFNLDFHSNRTGFNVSRSSTVKDADGLVACLKQGFEAVSLSAITHEHPTYSILYNASFVPKSGSGSASSGSAPSGTGRAGATAAPENGASAQIMWEVAIVRDRPRTGQVVARLPRGTNVRIGPGQDGWYQVKYGDGFTAEGWLYRAAIGK